MEEDCRVAMSRPQGDGRQRVVAGVLLAWKERRMRLDPVARCATRGDCRAEVEGVCVCVPGCRRECSQDGK